MTGQVRVLSGDSRPALARWLILVIVLTFACRGTAWSAPGPPTGTEPAIRAQGWLSNETAASLDIGFDVLVPPSVPAPFGGEPSVYAVPGYYRLYWVIYGGEPTFLEITGEVGGDIPDGSVYDLNVPLVVNAEVQGNPAYRDLTPIYDTVWWQAGDVVYSVSSRNLSGTDSLALANALIVVIPPAGGGGGGEVGAGNGEGSDGDPATLAPAVWVPAEVMADQVVTIWVEGSGVTLEVDGGTFLATGTTRYPDADNLGVEWQAPGVRSDEVVAFMVVDTATGEPLATAETLVVGSGTGGESATGVDDEDEPAASGTAPEDGTDEVAETSAQGDVVLGCPDVVISGRLAPIRLRATTEIVVEATQGGWPDEPGNRLFDEEVDGGPELTGVVPGDGPFFLHWRAPSVQSVVEARFVVRDPDGRELALCVSDVQPVAPSFRLGRAMDGDGSGGPFPDGRPPDAMRPDDGSGGPTATEADESAANPAPEASPEAGTAG